MFSFVVLQEHLFRIFVLGFQLELYQAHLRRLRSHRFDTCEDLKITNTFVCGGLSVFYESTEEGHKGESCVSAAIYDEESRLEWFDLSSDRKSVV